MQPSAPLGSQDREKIHFFPLFCRRCEMFPCFFWCSVLSQRDPSEVFDNPENFGHSSIKLQREDSASRTTRRTAEPALPPYRPLLKSTEASSAFNEHSNPFSTSLFYKTQGTLEDGQIYCGINFCVTPSGATKPSGMCGHRLQEFATTSKSNGVCPITLVQL